MNPGPAHRRFKAGRVGPGFISINLPLALRERIC
jgi:hypothetical protein